MSAKFKYAIRKTDSNYGVEDLRQLKDLVATGKLEPTDYVFIYETKEWKQIGELAELRSFFPGFAASSSARRSSDRIRQLPDLSQSIQARAAKEGAAALRASASQASTSSASATTTSQINMQTLFQGVLDNPKAATRPVRPASTPSVNAPRPAVPGASTSQTRLPVNVNSSGTFRIAPESRVDGANPGASSNRMRAVTPPPPAPETQPGLGERLRHFRPTATTYVLVFLLVAVVSAAMTFAIMFYSQSDKPLSASIPQTLPVTQAPAKN